MNGTRRLRKREGGGAPALEGLEEALGLGEGAVGEEERFEEDEIALGREEVLEQRLEGCGLDHLRVAARGLGIVGHSRPCSTQAPSGGVIFFR